MPKTSSKSILSIKRGKGSRLLVQAGDGFRIELSDGSQLRGCVVKDDAVVGPFRNALVIYVFDRGVTDLANILASRGLNALLLPPLITNQSPWETGLFASDGDRPLESMSVMPSHCFRNRLNRRLFDEYGASVAQESGRVGDFSLKFDGAVQAAIECALIEQ